MAASPRDPDPLLSHAGGVRELALRLMGDEAAAEDVAQDTWVRVLEQGSPARRGGSLADLVRSLAGHARRAASRRRSRERAAARPEATPSAAELVERAWWHRELVEAVVALEEPSRTCVLLRFFEGLPQREIAERLGVPVRTVNTRLQRGLARLRERLGPKLGPEARALFGVPALPLAMPVPGPGSLAAPTGLAAPSGWGTMIMNAKLLVAGAAALVVFGGAWWWAAGEPSASLAARGDGAEGVEVESSTPELASANAVLDEPRPTVGSGTPKIADTVRGAVSVPAATRTRSTEAVFVAPEPTLFGRVVGPDGSGLPGARVEVVFLPARDFSLLDTVGEVAPRPVIEVHADGAGEFRAVVPEERDYDLRVSAAGHATAQVAHCRANEPLTVVLDAAGVLFGRVTSSLDGKPVLDARVSVRPGLWQYSATGTYAAATDHEGRYRINGLPADVLRLSVESQDHAPLEGLLTELAMGAVRELDLVVEPGIRIYGQVISKQTGQPIEGAEVELVRGLGRVVRTDLAGRFSLVGPRGTELTCQVLARVEGYAQQVADVRLRSDPVRLPPIELARGFHARGKVLGLDGHPADGVRVTVVASSEVCAATTVGDGLFELHDLPPDARSIVLRRPGASTLVFDFPPYIPEREWVDFGNLHLRLPAAISGRVVDEEGLPLEGIHMRLVGCNGDRNQLSLREWGWGLDPAVLRKTTTDKAGRFGFEDLAGAAYTLSATSGFGGFQTHPVYVRGGTTKEDLELVLESGLSIEGRVTDADGEPLIGVSVGATNEAGHEQWTRSERGGRFRLQGLRAGVYSVDLSQDKRTVNRGFAPCRLEGIEAGTRNVVLRAPRPVRLSGRVLLPDGEPAPGGWIWASRPDIERLDLAYTGTDVDGRFELYLEPETTVDLTARWVGKTLPGLRGETKGIRVEPDGNDEVVIRLRE